MSMTWKIVLLPFSETVHEVFNLNVIQTIRFSRKVFFIYKNEQSVILYGWITSCYGFQELLKLTYKYITKK